MSSVSLLVVDDDPVFSRFVCQLLQTLGDQLLCRVTCADTAEKASVEINGSRFDLALLDYHLPGGSGLDLLAQIRRLPFERQPAVVMLTGSGNEAVAVEAMKGGAKDYGSERLLVAARRRLNLPLAQTLDELLADVRAFAGGNDFSDDVCLLGMEVAPTARSG